MLDIIKKTSFWHLGGCLIENGPIILHIIKLIRETMTTYSCTGFFSGGDVIKQS